MSLVKHVGETGMTRGLQYGQLETVVARHAPLDLYSSGKGEHADILRLTPNSQQGTRQFGEQIVPLIVAGARVKTSFEYNERTGPGVSVSIEFGPKDKPAGDKGDKPTGDKPAGDKGDKQTGDKGDKGDKQAGDKKK